MLLPFGMLEAYAYRELSSFEHLLLINANSDPLERMLIVASWFLTTLPQENFRRKPTNPVIGEVHECWIESKEFGKTSFLAEQTSHHPPLAVFDVVNLQERV